MSCLNRISFSFFTIAMFACVAILAGCSSRSPGGNEKSSADSTANASVGSTSSDDPGIDLQCIADRIQKAPTPFHWSFKKVVPPQTNADWEADIKSDSIVGTVIDGSNKQTIHAARSASTSWNTAVLVFSGPLPASTFAMVNHSSAMTRAGTEKVNGEDTIKYAIDTSRDMPADAALIKTIQGTDGFIKGSAWATRTGCPIKFVIDVEDHFKNGSVQKEHYEANVTKP